MLRRLTLRTRLQDVPRRPAEAQALLQRVETNTCSATERDLLAQVMRATTQVSAQLSDPSPPPAPRVSERPARQRQVKRTRQVAQASRRRKRCEHASGPPCHGGRWTCKP